MYLTYEEYLNMGGTLELAAFERLMFRVNGIMSAALHGRTAADPVPVKAACREIVDYIAANEQKGASVASRSQSAGNVSESETYKTAEDVKEDIENIIVDILGAAVDTEGRPLLYRGALY